MILKAVLNILSVILSGIINMVTGIFPEWNIAQTGTELLTTLFEWTTQALNFVNFIFGDTVFILLPIATALLVLKYTIIPIVIILRSIFINSNN